MEGSTPNVQQSVLGHTCLEVSRIGISSSYGIPGDGLERAFERLSAAR
jgi:hypothetical protein